MLLENNLLLVVVFGCGTHVFSNKKMCHLPAWLTIKLSIQWALSDWIFQFMRDKWRRDKSNRKLSWLTEKDVIFKSPMGINCVVVEWVEIIFSNLCVWFTHTHIHVWVGGDTCQGECVCEPVQWGHSKKKLPNYLDVRFSDIVIILNEVLRFWN
jgi:hypothetical protein